MPLKDYKKPNWYPDADVVATKSGWVYTKNGNEVLSAISNLDDKIAVLDDATTVPNPPSIEFLNSLNVKVSGLNGAPVSLKVGAAGTPVTGTTDANGDYTFVLTTDITPSTTLFVTQTDPDLNVSEEGSTTITAKMLKGTSVISASVLNLNGLSVVATLTNIVEGGNAVLYVDGVSTATVAISTTSGVKTATFTNVNVGEATTVKVVVKATDLTGKEIASFVKTVNLVQAI